MRETIKDLLPLKEELIKIKNEFDAYLVLEVVPEIYPGESSPCLAPSRDVIEFLYETGTEIDIDLYVYDNEKMKTDCITLATIEQLFYQYEQEVLKAERSGYLKENTVKTYLLHSENFVKWCKNEFEPGLRNK